MDAVIVGGGLIGLATAWRLRQSGWRVTVWDAGRIGGEASWAGAGMLAPGGEVESQTWWSDLALESLKLYPEFVRELEAASDLTIDYRRCGALECATTEQEWQALQQRATRQQTLGIAVHNAGARRLFYPDDAAVNPRDLVAALRIACQRSGVILREGSEVRGILVTNGRIVEPQSADVAVLAAGAWSSGIPISVEGSTVAIDPAVPIRGHLIAFPPTAQPPGPIWRDLNTYIVERSNGHTIAGSTTEEVGFNRDPDPHLFEDIEQRARRLKPALHAVERIQGWIGFRPGTRSGEPQLRQLENTPIYLAYGHYRNGILMAPATAASVTSSLQTGSFLQVSRL